MIQHGNHVDRVGADDGHRFGGGSVQQFGVRPGRTLPTAGNITLDEHHWSKSTVSWSVTGWAWQVSTYPRASSSGSSA